MSCSKSISVRLYFQCTLLYTKKGKRGSSGDSPEGGQRCFPVRSAQGFGIFAQHDMHGPCMSC